jgi:rod shape-determining protein MreC
VNRDSQRLRLTLVVLVLISFSLITLDSRSGKGGGALGGLRHATNTVFGPVQRGFGTVVHPVGSFISDLAHAGRDGNRVRNLQNQVDALQKQLRGDGDITRTKAELASLLALAGENQYDVLPARVTTVGDLSGFDQAATLNVGSRDGIRPYMTVINGQGLVGVVLSVTPFTSAISLADDPNVKVGSRLQRDAHVGITDGHGLGDMTFTPTDPTVRPRKGDVVETFGSSTYAPGVPIGVVTSIAPTPGKITTTATVHHYVDYTALDVVGVIIKTNRTTAAQPILPPRPTVRVTVGPTVTVTATPTGSATNGTRSSRTPSTSVTPGSTVTTSHPPGG